MDKIEKKEDGTVVLLRGGVDLLDGKNAMSCGSYMNGDYTYQSQDGFSHLIINEIDVLSGLNALAVTKNNEGYQYLKEDDGVKDWVSIP